MDSITHLFLGGAASNSLPDLDVVPLFVFSDDPLIHLTWHRATSVEQLKWPWAASRRLPDMWRRIWSPVLASKDSP